MASVAKCFLIALLAVILAAPLFSYTSATVQAQTDITFTPSDSFAIPASNATIKFALNGSCTSASLVNGSWTFANLKLNNSQPLGNLSFSATNSNITIFSYRALNLFGRSGQLRYNAQGVGTQTANLGLNLTQPTQSLEWSIALPGGVFLAEGSNWKLLPDDSVVISGLTGNVSVTHFGFFVPNDNNLPFYQQHSIAIITAIVLSILVAAAVVIRVKVRR